MAVAIQPTYFSRRMLDSLRKMSGPVFARPKVMSLVALVHGRGNPAYLLQSPDVRAASQDQKSLAGLLRAQRPSMRNALGTRKDGRKQRASAAWRK